MADSGALEVMAAATGRFYGDGLVWALRLRLPELFRWARLIPKVKEHEDGR